MERTNDNSTAGLLKWRGRSVEIAVGETFQLPCESPHGGCTIKFTFSVHQDLTASFSILQAGQVLHSEDATRQTGEVTVTDAGMCSICWANTHSFEWNGLLAPRSVTYEVFGPHPLHARACA